VWSGKREDEMGETSTIKREVDWKAIADDWQQIASVQGGDSADEGAAL